MKSSLLTNTWLDAEEYKPWNFRNVVLRFEDDTQEVGMWNGSYWAGQNGISQLDKHKRVVEFYIHERPTSRIRRAGLDI